MTRLWFGERLHLIIHPGSVRLGYGRFSVRASLTPATSATSVGVRVGGEDRCVGVALGALGRYAYAAICGVTPRMDERWTSVWVHKDNTFAGLWYDPFVGGGPRTWHRRRSTAA